MPAYLEAKYLVKDGIVDGLDGVRSELFGSVSLVILTGHDAVPL